jgi:hypothetical protein
MKGAAMTHTGEQHRAIWLTGLGSAFVWAEWGIVHSALARLAVVPWAVLFDLLVTLPAAYAWFVLRPARRPLSELLPACLLALACARLVLGGSPRLRLPLLAAGAALELGVLAMFVQASRRALQGGGDLVWRAQRARQPLVRMLGLELCVLHYALIAPFRRALPPADAKVFRNAAAPRQLLVALALISLLEAVGLHVVVYAYTPRLAWAVLALSVYGLLWLIAAHQALGARPVLVHRDRIELRMSLLYSASIPCAAVSGIGPCETHGREPGVVRLSLGARPNVLLQTSQPIAIHGPLGRIQHATRIAFYVEEPGAMIALVATRPL